MTLAKYCNNLPQLGGKIFLTDGGLETTLLFLEGFNLPHFAAFDLLKTSEGRIAIHDYLLTYVDVAKQNGTGIVLDTPTWRASSDWGNLLGYSRKDLDRVNQDAVKMLHDIRSTHETEETTCVVNGVVGPRSDGYNPAFLMTSKEAQSYHQSQIQSFSSSHADMITAVTMTYIDEAIGITKAAQEVGIPVVVSFTPETNGRLPNGMSLKNAVELTDEATNAGPAYYMINCAHPTHFDHTLTSNEKWLNRIGGLRANASALSHSELDEAEELDDGNPSEFGNQHLAMKEFLPNLAVVGGCCGTDHRHVHAAHGHFQ